MRLILDSFRTFSDRCKQLQIDKFSLDDLKDFMYLCEITKNWRDLFAVCCQFIDKYVNKIDIQVLNYCVQATKEIIHWLRQAQVQVKFRELNSKEKDFMSISTTQKTGVRNQLQFFCMSAVEIFNMVQESNYEKTDEMQTILFKTVADIYRYLSELDTNFHEQALNFQKYALRKCDFLSIANPNVIGLKINQSIFMFECLKKKDEAIGFAEQTYERLKEQNNKNQESLDLLRQLKDNITLWYEQK